MVDAAFPVFAGLAFLLLVIPFPVQVKSGNLGLICYVIWIMTVTIVYFVNSVVWFRTSDIKAPVWCDIATKLTVGAQVAIPTCSLAILRKLERIASTRQATFSPQDKRRDTIIDGVLGIAIPISYMATHVVAQGHRFDIVEGFGCQYDLYQSWPMLFLITLPPLFFILVSSIYAALALRWFVVRRRQFKAVLASRSGGLTTSRFVRLLILTSVEMLVSLPCQIINAYYNLKPSNFADSSFPQPYPSWAYVHQDFGYIGQAKQADIELVEPSFVIFAEILRWAVLVGAYVAFFCLGCSTDNLAQMRVGFAKFRELSKRRLGMRTTHESPSVGVQVHTCRDTRQEAGGSIDLDIYEKGLGNRVCEAEGVVKDLDFSGLSRS